MWQTQTFQIRARSANSGHQFKVGIALGRSRAGKTAERLISQNDEGQISEKRSSGQCGQMNWQKIESTDSRERMFFWVENVYEMARHDVGRGIFSSREGLRKCEVVIRLVASLEDVRLQPLFNSCSKIIFMRQVPIEEEQRFQPDGPLFRTHLIQALKNRRHCTCISMSWSCYYTSISSLTGNSTEEWMTSPGRQDPQLPSCNRPTSSTPLRIRFLSADGGRSGSTSPLRWRLPSSRECSNLWKRRSEINYTHLSFC